MKRAHATEQQLAQSPSLFTIPIRRQKENRPGHWRVLLLNKIVRSVPVFIKGYRATAKISMYMLWLYGRRDITTVDTGINTIQKIGSIIG